MEVIEVNRVPSWVTVYEATLSDAGTKRGKLVCSFEFGLDIQGEILSKRPQGGLFVVQTKDQANKFLAGQTVTVEPRGGEPVQQMAAQPLTASQMAAQLIRQQQEVAAAQALFSGTANAEKVQLPSAGTVPASLLPWLVQQQRAAVPQESLTASDVARIVRETMAEQSQQRPKSLVEQMHELAEARAVIDKALPRPAPAPIAKPEASEDTLLVGLLQSPEIRETVKARLQGFLFDLPVVDETDDEPAPSWQSKLIDLAGSVLVNYGPMLAGRFLMPMIDAQPAAQPLDAQPPAQTQPTAQALQTQPPAQTQPKRQRKLTWDVALGGCVVDALKGASTERGMSLIGKLLAQEPTSIDDVRGVLTLPNEVLFDLIRRMTAGKHNLAGNPSAVAYFDELRARVSDLLGAGMDAADGSAGHPPDAADGVQPQDAS